MKKVLGAFIVLIILVIVMFMSGLAYIVEETKQVVITQFGKPVGKPVVDSGLHFKKPFIQQTRYFEKRLLDWDGDPNQIPTKDKRYIWVDTTARWKISDALRFLQSVTNEMGAHARLDDIINSATRDAITGHILVETVRNSNRIIETKQQGESLMLTEEAIERIKIGRSKLEKLILQEARKLAPQYGIELRDVRIKRINYVEAVRVKVYDRMIAERKRAAEMYRSEGQGKRAEIDGQREKELKLITSKAYRTAQVVKGKADAESITIYARAYSQDPNFYSFLKTLETYRKTIDRNTTLILSADSEYYKYLTEFGLKK
ncbi:MAG: protease modulator HflC [Candidatus Omnitrophota bacterium]|nr:protease modulator HflC [Candidatus Omnitrophota bacterium]